MDDQVNDPLRTRREFCQQGKFGNKTLQRIESRGEGPPAIEITPGFVRYRQSAIDAWFAARTRTGARPAGKGNAAKPAPVVVVSAALS
jgi:predicted DNA-binding transcriptional regulator AlpA